MTPQTQMSYSVGDASGKDAALNEGLKKACDEFCRQFQESNLRGSELPSNVDREKANQALVEHLRAAYPKYNVMVVHPRHSQSFEDCSHLELSFSEFGMSHKFKVYVFKRGSFTLHGDGGLINWCFAGNFTRNDKHLTFHDV